jgi:hypothetical protein
MLPPSFGPWTSCMLGVPESMDGDDAQLESNGTQSIRVLDFGRPPQLDGSTPTLSGATVGIHATTTMT